MEQIICSRVERKNKNSTGDFIVLVTDSAILVHSFSNPGGNAHQIQQLDIIAEITVDVATELQQQPQLFRLTTDKGDVRTWGDTTYLSRRISCERKGDATRISFVRTSPNFEF